MTAGAALLLSLALRAPCPQGEGARSAVDPAPVRSDPTIRYDYDIVYVRAPRKGDLQQILWSDAFAPYQSEPGSDLVLLHPDGTEEVLVAAGMDSAAEPVVSFDGEWVFYALYHYATPTASGLLQSKSADLYKIHLPTRRIVRLTFQEFTPNTGVADPDVPAPGVYNLGPCPVPGGKIVFTSTRNGFVSSKNYKGFSGYEAYSKGDFKTSQLFVMDEDGRNVAPLGNMNLNGALGPSVLVDGRIVFSSFESEGLRDPRSWALWAMWPDGTHWQSLFGGVGGESETIRHFAAQRSDGKVVVEEYYLQNNHGFGMYFEMDPSAPEGEPYFGSASVDDPRNLATEGYGKRVLFSPRGLRAITPFAHSSNRAARALDPKDPKSPRLGKVTHPAPAPDNGLLTVWSPGPVYGRIDTGMHAFAAPAIDSGIYLMRGGEVADLPSKLRLVKNDPRYDEKWPRAVVPYARIHGVREPASASPFLARQHPISLPPAAPFGFLGSASLWKRESYPRGAVAPGAVTASYAGGRDPHLGLGSIAQMGGNWFSQGADAGRYGNEEIHAIRVLAMEPTTDPALLGRTARRWWNAGNERLRIFGEVPVRKWSHGAEPRDLDGNPDTSFLVKLPADVPWTLQTIDREGRVLNMAQTWHVLRPGERRTDCGGCHAHSQAPTPFESTAAAREGFAWADLSATTPLLTSKDRDESGQKWDSDDASGLRYAKAPVTVEYFRDVRPILERSCVACHTKSWEKPAGNLVLDDGEKREVDGGRALDLLVDKPPARLEGTYLRLALDPLGRFGHPSRLGSKSVPNPWFFPQGSRYVRHFQSRRSLLVWKIYGRRLDGFTNEDFACESEPGNPRSVTYRGRPFDLEAELPKNRDAYDLAFVGSVMPPPKAIAGTYESPEGKTIRVEPLADEDRRTIVRWIDLGCPVDLTGVRGAERNNGGWFDDENRPTLVVDVPESPRAQDVAVLVVGMSDIGSGLDPSSLSLTANFDLASAPAGTNLAPQLRDRGDGTWELRPPGADPWPEGGTIVATVADRAGNRTRVEQSWGPAASRPRVSVEEASGTK